MSKSIKKKRFNEKKSYKFFIHLDNFTNQKGNKDFASRSHSPIYSHEK